MLRIQLRAEMIGIGRLWRCWEKSAWWWMGGQGEGEGGEDDYTAERMLKGGNAGADLREGEP